MGSFGPAPPVGATRERSWRSRSGLRSSQRSFLNERRAEQPIMPLRLFASRERVGAYAARFLFLGGMVPFWFFATQYLQIVKGFSPYQAGLAFLPVTLPNFASAMAVPRLTRRFGNARLLAGGLVISVIGMAWLGLVSAGSPYVTGV